MPTQPQSFIKRHQFWLFLIVAFVVRQIPFISLPFNWLESYFHEISHGLIAIATGGQIRQIELFANGAGLCTTAGGIRFWISFAGYTGAIFWGTLLYLMAIVHENSARIISGTLCLFILLSVILWVRDIRTLFICSVLILMFGLMLKTKWLHLNSGLLKLMGMTVLLNAITSPFYLLDGRSIGDGATLSNISGIPEMLWVGCWFLLGMSSLYWLWRKL